MNVFSTLSPADYRGTSGLDRRGNPSTSISRDKKLRDLYADVALAQVPRLLGAIDRNPFRTTFGSIDRQYWHYRTADFASEMYQEAVLPLALVYQHKFPGNRWYRQPRLKELVVAALRFSASNGHRDGSCDDYYPFERALGAAVFSLTAGARAYQLLQLDDPGILDGFRRRAQWIMGHGESGRLANHHALAAWALLLVGQITGDQQFHDAAEARVRTLLTWQSDEGWFDEYGGADPGYQTLTVDCLAMYGRETQTTWLDEPIARAVRFCRLFLHPDDSYAGCYGSRGTHHFFPRGMELLAADSADAADLADGFLRALAQGKQACFDDDRLVAHRLGNLLEAYLEWSATRPELATSEDANESVHLEDAGLVVHRAALSTSVVSTSRGGIFRHFHGDECLRTDAGLIVRLSNGRLCTSQWHDRTRQASYVSQQHASQPGEATLTVTSPLHYTRFELATPLKNVILRVGMLLVGRFCRELVRRALQRRMITGRDQAPVQLERTLHWPAPIGENQEGRANDTPSLIVTDVITLTDPRVEVVQAAFASDLESAYVAVSGVYQDSVLEPWVDLQSSLHELNQKRRVVIERRYFATPSRRVDV